MKTLTNQQIKFVLELMDCFAVKNVHCNKCPFEKECVYYFTGEKCGSCLEQNDSLTLRN